MKFLILALTAVWITGMISGAALVDKQFGLAAVIFACGTYLVFTLGRLSGMREITTELKGQNGPTDS